MYGSDPVRAAALRTFQGGKLKTSADGQLLPLNTAGLPNADPFHLGANLFLAGDVRANEQANLTAVHTLFVREHNRLADRIHDRYSDLTDEQIYQVARRLVGAEMQAITYEEYLPAVLGFDHAPDPDGRGLRPGRERRGHQLVRPRHLPVRPQPGQRGHPAGGQRTARRSARLSIRDAFFNPSILQDDPGQLGSMLKGLASQVGQENDLLLVDGIRNNLFGPPGAGGLDLAALDIQRGRDHGLPDYNILRGTYGLARVTSFAEISSDPADPGEAAAALRDGRQHRRLRRRPGRGPPARVERRPAGQGGRRQPVRAAARRRPVLLHERPVPPVRRRSGKSSTWTA